MSLEEVYKAIGMASESEIVEMLSVLMSRFHQLHCNHELVAVALPRNDFEERKRIFEGIAAIEIQYKQERDRKMQEGTAEQSLGAAPVIPRNSY